MTKEEMARLEGMSYALRYARQNGLKALEKELDFRCAHKIPLKISDKDVQAFTENVKNMILDTVLILVDATLHDEFGFGHDRLARFKNRFDLKTACLGQEYATWQDYIDMLEEECKMHHDIRLNNSHVILK